MNKTQKKEFLIWAYPCLQNERIRGLVNKARLNGEIDEEIIKKNWDYAYKNIQDYMNNDNPMKDYMFSKHNDRLKNNKAYRFCLALVGQVKQIKKDKIIVDVLGKELEIINKCNAKKGDYVGIHRKAAVEKLSKDDFNNYNKKIKNLKDLI